MIASKNTPQQFPLVNSSVSEDNQNFDADVFDDLLKDDAKKNEGVESLENVNADTVDNNNEKDDHLIPIPPMPEEGENLNQYSRKMAFFQNHRSAVLKKNSLSMAQSMAQQRSRKEKNKGIYHEEFESTLMSQLHIAKRFRVIAGAAIANEIKNPGGVQKNIMNSRKKKTRHDGCHLSVLSAEVEESLGTVLDKAVLDFKANATCRYGDRSTIVPLYLLASVALGRHHHPSPDCDAIHIEKDPKKIGGLTRKLNFSLNSISSYTKSSRATATIQYSRMVTAEKSLLSRAYGEALKVYEEKHSFFQDKDTLKIEAQNNVVPPYRPPSEYIIRVMTTSLNNMNKLQDVRESLRRHRLLDVLHRDSNITPINFHEVFTGTATLPPIPAVLRMRSRKVNTFMPRFCIPEILSEAAASRDSLVYVGPVQPALELPKSVISEAIPNLGVGSQGNTPPSKVVSATPQSSFPPINRYPLALEFNLSDEASDKRSALEPCIERSREIRLIGEMKQQKLDRQVENFAALQVPGGGGKTLSEVMLERGVDVIGLTREMQKKVMDRFYKERKEKVDIKRQFMYGVRPLTSSDDTFI